MYTEKENIDPINPHPDVLIINLKNKIRVTYKATKNIKY